VGSRSIPLYQ